MHGFTTNFHTHTARCKHATGTDREMVQAALDAGGHDNITAMAVFTEEDRR